jgi:DNA polymerase III epsilon subunit-like protein
MNREIILDTETTGLNPFQGDKIIEIAAIELIDHISTEKKISLLYKSRKRYTRNQSANT